MIIVKTKMRMRMKSKMIIMMTMSNLLLISVKDDYDEVDVKLVLDQCDLVEKPVCSPVEEETCEIVKKVKCVLTIITIITNITMTTFPDCIIDKDIDQVEVNLVPEEVCRLESKESCNQVPKETCVDIQVVKKQLTKVSKKLSKAACGRCQSVKQWTRIFATRSPGQCASWSRG